MPDSSPRMREIYCLVGINSCCVRFNFAHAGNIVFLTESEVFKQVYPRVCGEYAPSCTVFVIVLGSTPRMRGIFRRIGCRCIDIRFNPAYAGNMESPVTIDPIAQVQPRVCGEYRYRLLALDGIAGSTPRMRGIFRFAVLICQTNRLNPAYAGNICRLIRPESPIRVQPRVCGEYVLHFALFSFILGSTPRMRGIFCLISFRSDCFRFNPAYAGNIRERSYYDK